MRRYEARPEVATALGGNLHLKNKVLKLGFSKGFWMLPFPTKYKDESVDDYLQYQVTQPLCHLGGGKEAWPKKNHSFLFFSVFVAFYRELR